MALARFRLAGNAVGRGQYAAQHRFLLNGQNLRGSIPNSQNIIAEIDTPTQSVRAFGHLPNSVEDDLFILAQQRVRGVSCMCSQQANQADQADQASQASAKSSA